MAVLDDGIWKTAFCEATSLSDLVGNLVPCVTIQLEKEVAKVVVYGCYAAAGEGGDDVADPRFVADEDGGREPEEGAARGEAPDLGDRVRWEMGHILGSARKSSEKCSVGQAAVCGRVGGRQVV
ncbi:hypothetical protein Tco_0532267 [Tanacetum coccineum]